MKRSIPGSIAVWLGFAACALHAGTGWYALSLSSPLSEFSEEAGIVLPVKITNLSANSRRIHLSFLQPKEAGRLFVPAEFSLDGAWGNPFLRGVVTNHAA